MKTQTSLEAYYAELKAGKISDRQREVLDYAISRNAFGQATFTRADIKAHFGDQFDSYVVRARELADMGLLVQDGTTVNSKTKKENNTWRASDSVLEGIVHALPTYRIFSADNLRLVEDLLVIHQKWLDGQSPHDLEQVEILKSIIVRRMKCGVLRNDDGTPVRIVI